MIILVSGKEKIPYKAGRIIPVIKLCFYGFHFSFETYEKLILFNHSGFICESIRLTTYIAFFLASNTQMQ